MKLAFYVVADRVTHNAILVAQVQTWMASGGKCYWTVTVWRCCCCSSETGPSSTEWALGAYCFDFALFISLKTRGYPTANRYNRDPYTSRNVHFGYIGAGVLERKPWVKKMWSDQVHKILWTWGHLDTKRLQDHRMLLPCKFSSSFLQIKWDIMFYCLE